MPESQHSPTDTSTCQLCNRPTIYPIPPAPFPGMRNSEHDPPSEEQIIAIDKAILQAKQNRQALDLEVSLLKTRLNRLETQRARLSSFISSHLGMKSVLRHMPDDILIEIFWCCMTTGLPDMAIIRSLSLVCQRWQNIILAVSSFWRHLEFGYYYAGATEAVKFQLQHSGNTALAVTFDGYFQDPTSLQLVKDTIPRWEYMSLQQGYEEILLFQHAACSFEKLKQLEISVAHSSVQQFQASNIDFVSTLPALTDLSLDLGNQQELPVEMHALLPQLHRLQLTMPNLNDLIALFPRFPMQMHLVLITGRGIYHSAPTLPPGLVIQIQALTLNCANDRNLSAMIFGHLTAPYLQNLVFTTRCDSESIMTNVQQFLKRTSCSLKYLNLALGRFFVKPDQLAGAAGILSDLLSVPELCNLLELKINMHSYQIFHDSFLAEILHIFQNATLLPMLCSLDISADIYPDALNSLQLQKLAQRSESSNFHSLFLRTSHRNTHILESLPSGTLEACKALGLNIHTFHK